MEEQVLNNLHRELTCIQFPAVVKNEEKALECLGGIKTISQIHAMSSKKRLGMTFQPENPFVKKLYADVKPTSAVLLRIKIKKKKSGNEVKREVVSTSVIGSVNTIYKFDSMCDFQYLPIVPNVPGGSEFKCILEDIIPSGLDNITTLLHPAPTFIVPSNFTRSDKSMHYYYTERRYAHAIKNEPSVKEEVEEIYKRRSDRSVPVVKYTFKLTDDLPTEPNEYYIQQKNNKLELYPQLTQEYEMVEKLFQERPIWSMNYIKFCTKIKISILKIVMPCLAIYMREGPWRMMWVRYGYDPRRDPEARKYQTLDFRLRHAAGVHNMVVTRDEVVHVKKTDRLKTGSQEEHQSEDVVGEGAVRLRPGLVPSQRQIFYQYCDIDLPEVQAIVGAPPPPGYSCHAKLGWLPPDADHACRDHVFRYVKQALLATHNADLKLEQVSSGDEMSSDDEANNTTITEVGENSNT